MRRLSKLRRRSLLKSGAVATGLAAVGLLPSGGFAFQFVTLLPNGTLAGESPALPS